MPLRKEVDLEKTVAAASGVFRDVCSEEPPYHTAEELWEGLKQGDEGARLLFVFFLRLRKNERTRCSVEKAIAAEGKRWVAVLIEEALIHLSYTLTDSRLGSNPPGFQQCAWTGQVGHPYAGKPLWRAPQSSHL